MDFSIRALRREEAAFPFELAAAEGWNSGTYDATPFFAADPHGFLVAEDAEETKLGCIAAVRYDTYGFIGLFIVRAEYRGNGIGRALLAAALERLAGLPVGLDAIPAEEDRYARAGFVRAYTTVRYRWSSIEPRDRFASQISLERLRVLDDDVVAYDRACFGAARAPFLQAWVAQPDVVALVARSLATASVLGYAVCREARDGAKFGPLFASRLDVAALLLDTVASRARPPWRLDIPSPNVPALALAEDRGMTRGTENVRMWRGDPPALDLSRTYGITSFELG